MAHPSPEPTTPTTSPPRPKVRIDRVGVCPESCSQEEWDELIQVVHLSGQPVLLSSSAFAFFLGSEPPARRIGDDRWLRESDGPILELLRERGAAEVAFVVQVNLS